MSGRPELASARPLTVQSSKFLVSREEESVLTVVTVTIRAGRSHEPCATWSLGIWAPQEECLGVPQTGRDHCLSR